MINQIIKKATMMLEHFVIQLHAVIYPKKEFKILNTLGKWV